MSDLVVMTKDDLKKFGLDLLAEHDKRSQKEPTLKEWLSEEEVLRELGIKKPTLAKLRHERKIMFNKTQRPYTYHREAVELYKRSRSVGKVI